MHALIHNGAVAAYPYDLLTFRKDHPSVSLPQEPTQAQLEEVGLFAVVPSTKPQATVEKVVIESAPVLSGGVWTRTWLEREATASEVAIALADVSASIVEQTQQRLDDFAKTRNYDNILSACTYASSTVPKFAAEGQYCVDARDSTWATLYTIMAEVEAGTRPAPTGYADIEPDLPVLIWPN